MIRNIIFLILTIASLIWIFFAGQELINFTGNENPERLFGEEDGRVLIVNRSNEIELSHVDFHIQPRISNLVHLLNGNQLNDERLIISELKAHVVIEKNQPIDNERILELFANEEIIKVTNKKFLWKEYTIERSKGVVDIYIASEKVETNDEKWYSFDKKSSCSIVQFNHGKPIITDYYQKDGVISTYNRAPHLVTSFKSVDDREIFANRIPVFITSYRFEERNYAVRHDPIFQESIANKWANIGMVTFEYKNHSFLLMDFIRGKEPDLFLDNYRNLKSESENHYKDLAITKNFPNNPKSGFYMRIFEDHVLFAENEDALLDLESSLELGQMLSMNKTKSALIYSQTPKSVCFRQWENDKKIAKSTYNGSAITVEVKTAKVIQMPDESENRSTGFGLDGIGKNLLLHPSKDLVFALSDANSLFGINKNQSLFKLDLKEPIKGNIQWTDHKKEEIFLTGTSKIHVINEKGAYLPGFPKEIPGGISKEVTSFTWKNKTNFLVVNNTGTYFWLNEQGDVVSEGNTEVSSMTAQPVIWTSQRRLFFGFHGDGNFSMIEAQKKTLLRNFPLPIGVHTAVLSNEVVFYSLEENSLYKYNQRGAKVKIANHQNTRWLKVDNSKDGSFFIQEGKTLFHYADNGKMQRSIKISLDNVDCIKLIDKTAKGTVLGVVDGIRNRVSLFRTDGRKIPMENNIGQYQFDIWTSNGLSKLYTLSDKFVIHYVL